MRPSVDNSAVSNCYLVYLSNSKSRVNEDVSCSRVQIGLETSNGSFKKIVPSKFAELLSPFKILSTFLLDEKSQV